MSKAIEDLKHEHEAILSGLEILETMSARASAGGHVAPGDLQGFIGFLKEFADKCHHGKEEGFLFPTLTSAGVPREGSPVHALLEDHKQGRSLIRQMEAAISPSVNAGAFGRAAREYVGLLRLHIQKENTVLFPSAEQGLAEGQLAKLFQSFEQHEQKVIGAGRHEALHALLKSLKEKYPAQA